MTYRLEYSEGFANELVASVEWYSTKRPGLGDELLADLKQVLARIAEGPDTFPRVLRATRAVRSVRLETFPYRIVYRRKDDVIRVLALAHLKRRPLHWRHRDP